MLSLHCSTTNKRHWCCLGECAANNTVAGGSVYPNSQPRRSPRSCGFRGGSRSSRHVLWDLAWLRQVGGGASSGLALDRCAGTVGGGGGCLRGLSHVASAFLIGGGSVLRRFARGRASASIGRVGVGGSRKLVRAHSTSPFFDRHRDRTVQIASAMDLQVMESIGPHNRVCRQAGRERTKHNSISVLCAWISFRFPTQKLNQARIDLPASGRQCTE